MTYRASEGSWCAARRSTPSPLRSTNDAVAVLADVTVDSRPPIALDAAEMQNPKPPFFMKHRPSPLAPER